MANPFKLFSKQYVTFRYNNIEMESTSKGRFTRHSDDKQPKDIVWKAIPAQSSSITTNDSQSLKTYI